MLITLSRHTLICQSVAEVQVTGVTPLGAVSPRLNYMYIYILIQPLEKEPSYPYFIFSTHELLGSDSEHATLWNAIYCPPVHDSVRPPVKLSHYLHVGAEKKPIPARDDGFYSLRVSFLIEIAYKLLVCRESISCWNTSIRMDQTFLPSIVPIAKQLSVLFSKKSHKARRHKCEKLFHRISSIPILLLQS